MQVCCNITPKVVPEDNPGIEMVIARSSTEHHWAWRLTFQSRRAAGKPINIRWFLFCSSSTFRPTPRNPTRLAGVNRGKTGHSQKSGVPKCFRKVWKSGKRHIWKIRGYSENPENREIREKRDIRKIRGYRYVPEKHENQETAHLKSCGVPVKSVKKSATHSEPRLHSRSHINAHIRSLIMRRS